MKKNYIVIILTCMVLTVQAQTPTLEWVKHMESLSDSFIGWNEGNSITIDANGNIYSTGTFLETVDFDPGSGIQAVEASGGNYDIYIQKLDTDGNLLWIKTMGGESGDIGFSISTDADGNVYSTGTFSGTVDFDPGPGIYNLSTNFTDTYVQKLDADGNFLWAIQIPSFFLEPSGVTTTTDGGVLVMSVLVGWADFDPGPGEHILTSEGDRDIAILKLDSDGNFIWAKQIGGIGWERIGAIDIDAHDNIYTTGSFADIVDFDPGPGVHNLTSAGSWNSFVQKLDSDGNFLWAKQIESNVIISVDCAVDANGSVYITGDFFGTVDFDSGSDVHNLTAIGESTDVFVQKLDTDGNFLWAKQIIKSSNNDNAQSITTDANNHVIITGLFTETADFDPGAGVHNLTSNGIFDVFTQKLDTDGNLLWVIQTGGIGGEESANSATVDSNGNIYIIGGFEGTVDFDPGLGMQNYTAASITDIYIQKIQDNVVSSAHDIPNKSFAIYPNPVSSHFTIELESVMADIEINITDTTGKLIHSSHHQNTDKINLVINQPAGTYFVGMKTPEDGKTMSIIKK